MRISFNTHKYITQVAAGAVGLLLFAPAINAEVVTPVTVLEGPSSQAPLNYSPVPSTVDNSIDTQNAKPSVYSGFVNSAVNPIQTETTVSIAWPTTTTRISRGLSGSGTITNNRVSASAGHTGVDIDCETGYPIYSVLDGTVIVADSGGPFGNKVMVQHENTPEDTELKSMYAHLNTIGVTVGQDLRAGDYLGTCGATGNSHGDHLHWEMYIDNVVIDPLGYYYEYAI